VLWFHGVRLYSQAHVGEALEQGRQGDARLEQRQA
jgi:hypothetical protein